MLPSEVIDQVLGTLKQSWQARPSRLAKDEVSHLLCICIAWPKSSASHSGQHTHRKHRLCNNFSGSLSIGRA